MFRLFQDTSAGMRNPFQYVPNPFLRIGKRRERGQMMVVQLPSEQPSTLNGPEEDVDAPRTAEEETPVRG